MCVVVMMLKPTSLVVGLGEDGAVEYIAFELPQIVGFVGEVEVARLVVHPAICEQQLLLLYSRLNVNIAWWMDSVGPRKVVAVFLSRHPYRTTKLGRVLEAARRRWWVLLTLFK
jgi:hypothetical protein